MTPARAQRSAADILWWLVPSLVCLLIHWQGFTAWFRADDFAWLSNFYQIHNFSDLLRALFRPEAQGTIRPLSERAFFIVGYGLFGLDSLPFRIVIFATQFAALALAAVVGAKLTGSRAAGFCAALLWTVNSTTVQPLAWACVYNEVLCSFFLLLAFYLLLRYIETGERRFKIFEWLAFLVGFGALELNVVYPVLAGAYTLLCARKFFRGTLPMLAVSIAYAVMHTLVAPPARTGDYAMHFDGSILRTLAVYWTWSVGPVYLQAFGHFRRWMVVAAIALLSLALLAFVAQRLRAGYRVALFCLAWFVIAFGPLLPLRDHRTEYYPYVPVIGLAWLGGWGLVQAWRSGAAGRAAALLFALLYLGLVLPRTLTASQWNHDLTIKAENLVEGVARAHQLHPNDALLLDYADSDQFWNAIRDKAFRLIGVDRVYLAPGSEKTITEPSNWGRVEEFVLDPGVVSAGLDRDQLQVYDVHGAVLRNITGTYAKTAHQTGLPLRVRVSDPLTAYLLGPEWYSLDTDHRWMPKRATLRMGAPAEPGKSLYLTGYSPQGLGPVAVTLTVDGLPTATRPVQPGAFDVAFPLPAEAVGKAELQVAVEVSHTFLPPGDVRPLGLSFGVFEIR